MNPTQDSTRLPGIFPVFFRLSTLRFLLVVVAFCLTGQANTAIQFYMRLRKLIASKMPSYELTGEIEADESYFGGVRKGRRGRGAAGKVAVFGLLKRGGKFSLPSSPMPKPRRFCPSSRSEWNPTASSIPTPSDPTMLLT